MQPDKHPAVSDGPEPHGICGLCGRQLTTEEAIRSDNCPDCDTSPAMTVREEAAVWLEYFRESANPRTTAERWEYLDEAATLLERLLEAARAD